MAVPIGAGMKLQDITQEIYGDVNAGRSLDQCFVDSLDYAFDPVYQGSKDRQTNFQNYNALLDVSNQANTGRTLVMQTTSGDKQDVAFSSNGFQMFVLLKNGYIQTYEITGLEPYNILNAVYQALHQFSTSSGDKRSFSFSDDGYTVYVTKDGSPENEILEYIMVTPWLISSMSFVGALATGMANPYGMEVHPDGKRIWVNDYGNDDISEFATPVAWELNGGVKVKTHSYGGSTNVSSFFVWVNGGSTMFQWQNLSNYDGFDQFTASTPYDISTIGSVQAVGVNIANMRGTYLIPNSNRILLVSEDTNTIYEYTY